MNVKITNQMLLTELMLKLERIDCKLDKLLDSDLRVVTNVSVIGSSNSDEVAEQIKNSLMTNQEFDEEMK